MTKDGKTDRFLAPSPINMSFVHFDASGQRSAYASLMSHLNEPSSEGHCRKRLKFDAPDSTLDTTLPISTLFSEGHDSDPEPQGEPIHDLSHL